MHQSEHLIASRFPKTNNQQSKVLRYTPTALGKIALKLLKSLMKTIKGLFCIPFLPMICDHPVEYLTDEFFNQFWPVEGEKKSQ